MPENEEVLKVIREWVTKAENDLKNASYTVQLGEDCPTDTVCFHAQQCVEKYLKALLILKGIDFPKTHDISQMLALILKRLRPELSPEEQRRLTDYATITRYPGDYEPVPLTETRRALRIARRVRGEVRKNLPKEILRKRRL